MTGRQHTAIAHGILLPTRGLGALTVTVGTAARELRPTTTVDLTVSLSLAAMNGGRVCVGGAR